MQMRVGSINIAEKLSSRFPAMQMRVGSNSIAEKLLGNWMWGRS